MTISATTDGDGWQLWTLNPPGEEDNLLALCQADSTGNAWVAGGVRVKSYALQRQRLVVVPVGSSQASFTKAQLQTDLNAIYAQAVCEWEVSIDAALPLTGIDDLSQGITVGETDYSEHQRQVWRALVMDRNPVPGATYLFIIPGFKDHPAMTGYMPLKSGYGFLAPQATPRDAAHELGHGAFNLRHTFSNDNVVVLPEGSTQNLMDYPSAGSGQSSSTSTSTGSVYHSGQVGSELWKYQWDYIHNPEGGWFLWEDMEEGAGVSNTLFGNPVVFILNHSESKFYYCTPNGEDLPNNLLELTKDNIPFNYTAKKCSISDLNNGIVFFREINSNGTGFRMPTSEYQLLLDDSLLTTASQERVNVEFTSVDSIVLMRKRARDVSFKKVINVAVTEKTPDPVYVFEVVREITSTQPRTDTYKPEDKVGDENEGDAIVEPGEVITFKLLKGTDYNSNDFIAVSDVDWYSGSRFVESGTTLSYEILEDTVKFVNAKSNGSNFWIYLEIREVYKYNNPDTTRIYSVNVDALDDADKQTGRNMYSTSLESIKSTSNPNVNLNNIINIGKIEVFLKKDAEMDGVNGIANASYSEQYDYRLLRLINIEKDRRNVIINADLVRGLTAFERQALIVSANNLKINSLSEWLLYRISQSPQGIETANALRNSIVNGETLNENILDSLYNPVQHDEFWHYIRVNSTGYMTIELNYCDLKDDITNFKRTLAHELLHLHWSFYRTPERLLWIVIRERKDEYGYKLADGLNENRFCSKGDGHERNNPENEFVCTNQDNY